MVTTSGIVVCRATGDLCVVYRAWTERQARGGHELGKWYVRLATAPGSFRASHGYDSPAEAMAMLDYLPADTASFAPFPLPLREPALN